MVPKPAQYLLRFDDLCPTISRSRWERFVPLIEEFGIKPILAIVPDNKDPDLLRADPDPEFWGRMRELEAAGAMIAVHGYQHLCHSKGKSLVPLHRQTEFAGVPLDTQRWWVEHGLELLRNEGLNPGMWIAPRHGFDRNTLLALRSSGIKMLSDGFARVPFTRGGVTWIPQQLWGPVYKTQGLWTICVHTNTARESLPQQLRGFLQRQAAQFTSVERVMAELKPGGLGVGERLYEAYALWRARGLRSKRRSGRRSRA